jgi:hypothetical protein
MTSVLPPLPTSLPVPAPAGAVRGIPVQSFPVPGGTPPREIEPLALPALGDFASRPFETPAPAPASAPAAAPAETARKTAPGRPPEPDFTDSDLTAALLPLVGAAAAGSGLNFHDDASFEAVLRATFRRALAEQHAGPFQDPDLTHRILWRAQALFTSRSYDEVLADKIRRFSVEEVFLLDRDKLSLISYASCDPVRHANPRRVGSFAKQLAIRVKDESGALLLGFELGENRRTFVRPGRFCHLVAVIRGEINDLVKADLDFALRRIETRFEEPFVQGRPLLKELQPLLEECLLIHSPAAPPTS